MTSNQMTSQASTKKFLKVPSSSGKAHVFVRVEVIGERAQFGRRDVLIRPIDGRGEMWVSMDSLSE